MFIKKNNSNVGSLKKKENKRRTKKNNNTKPNSSKQKYVMNIENLSNKRRKQFIVFNLNKCQHPNTYRSEQLRHKYTRIN